MPYIVVLCNKTTEEKEIFRAMMFVFPRSYCTQWSPAVLEKQCLSVGSNDLIPCFAMLLCVAFAFLITPFLSQSMSFLALALLILSPIPLKEAE